MVSAALLSYKNLLAVRRIGSVAAAVTAALFGVGTADAGGTVLFGTNEIPNDPCYNGQ